jgi:Flp pilus assembly pilin Flp
MKNHHRKVYTVLEEKAGQGMIEYAVIIGVVIVVAVALVIVFGSQIETLFNSVTSALSAI